MKSDIYTPLPPLEYSKYILQFQFIHLIQKTKPMSNIIETPNTPTSQFVIASNLLSSFSTLEPNKPQKVYYDKEVFFANNRHKLTIENGGFVDSESNLLQVSAIETYLGKSPYISGLASNFEANELEQSNVVTCYVGAYMHKGKEVNVTKCISSYTTNAPKNEIEAQIWEFWNDNKDTFQNEMVGKDGKSYMQTDFNTLNKELASQFKVKFEKSFCKVVTDCSSIKVATNSEGQKVIVWVIAQKEEQKQPEKPLAKGGKANKQNDIVIQGN